MNQEGEDYKTKPPPFLQDVIQASYDHNGLITWPRTSVSSIVWKVLHWAKSQSVMLQLPSARRKDL